MKMEELKEQLKSLSKEVSNQVHHPKLMLLVKCKIQQTFSVPAYDIRKTLRGRCSRPDWDIENRN